MLNYTPLDDKQLLDLLKTGDEGAFTELYHRYWKLLFAVAANKLQSASEAQEVVQDIFLDIWNRRQVIDISSKLSSYLSVALKYKVINLLARKDKERQYVQVESSSLKFWDRSTEQQLSFDELKERLAKHVSQLPDQCRLVFELSREQGLSRKEISAQLRISEKTVEAHLTKALRRLRLGLNNFLSFML
jgi:RNA polymerase sigma-70 factor (ECF subfamily)